MPTITLKFNDQTLGEYHLEIGSSLTIGRHESNDIVIENLAVSGVHARIDSVSATFVLTDLDSTNGTFVNNTLIASHALRNHDIFIIGKHTLTFDRSDIEKKPGLTNKEDSKTYYLDTDKYRDLINKKTVSEHNASRQPIETSAQNEEGGLISRWFRKLFS